MSAQIRSAWRELPPVLARKNCNICRGTGWELFVLDGYSKARRCSCRSLDQLERLRRDVQIPLRYEHCRLDQFIPQNLSQTRALAHAHSFIGRYPDVSRGLFISGPPGVGKTHLAVGIVRDLLLRFHDDVLFVDFASILRSHLSQFRRGCGPEFEWHRLKKASLLVLDDFAWQSPTQEGLLIVEDLLQGRWLLKKLTLLTGESVSCRALFGKGRSRAARSSATQTLLSSLSTQTLMRLLTQLRMIVVTGDDYRITRVERGMLF
jgi:DNA replication protein DnaC